MSGILTATEIYDPMKGHAAYEQGRQEAGNALAGMALAKGDQAGASKALFSAGNWTAGLQLQQVQQQRAEAAQAKQRAEQQRAFQALSGVVREIKTPDQFERAKASVARTLGVDVGKYTFDDLPTLQAQFTQANRELALKERAQQEAHRYLKAEKGAFYDTQTKQWITPPAGQTPDEYGLNPVYGKDAQGNPVLLQVGKSGRATLTQIPSGVTVSGGVTSVPTETGTMLVDKRTGQPISQIAKDIQGKQAATVRGKAQGEAQTQFRTANRDAQFALETIETLRNHPGRAAATGLSSWIPNRPGSDAYNFTAELAKAKAKTFMQAREGLKGAGQVTDFEGLKGEQAIANLDAAQGEEQFLQAVAELERMIKVSLDDLKKRAGGDFGVPIQPLAPAITQLTPAATAAPGVAPAASLPAPSMAQPAPQPQPKAAPAGARPAGKSAAQLRADARAAVAAGAPKEAVRAQLKQWGVDF